MIAYRVFAWQCRWYQRSLDCNLGLKLLRVDDLGTFCKSTVFVGMGLNVFDSVKLDRRKKKSETFTNMIFQNFVQNNKIRERTSRSFVMFPYLQSFFYPSASPAASSAVLQEKTPPALQISINPQPFVPTSIEEEEEDQSRIYRPPKFTIGPKTFAPYSYSYNPKDPEGLIEAKARAVIFEQRTRQKQAKTEDEKREYYWKARNVKSILANDALSASEKRTLINRLGGNFYYPYPRGHLHPQAHLHFNHPYARFYHPYQ